MGHAFWFCIGMAVFQLVKDVRAGGRVAKAKGGAKVFHFWHAYQFTHLTHTWAAAAVVIGALK